jgi:hypothetical protein
MDLRRYYQKMRQIEAAVSEPYVVLVSLETPDGGKAGLRTEVPRELAARYVVDSRARLASEEETRAFQNQQQAARKEAERKEAASRIQLAVISESELVSGRGPSRGSK